MVIYAVLFRAARGAPLGSDGAPDAKPVTDGRVPEASVAVGAAIEQATAARPEERDTDPHLMRFDEIRERCAAAPPDAVAEPTVICPTCRSLYTIEPDGTCWFCRDGSSGVVARGAS
ncbi:MAG TPA: hypothetical protein VH062_01875 [Polyangiaceae bacterium]|nr:hypothetical protein [Polyangiaceae bacterium]